MKKSNLYFAILFLLVDALALIIGLALAYDIRSSGSEIYFWSYERYMLYCVFAVPVWLIIFANQGLYNPRKLPKGWSALAKIFVSLVAGWGVILITLYLWRSPEALVLPRLVIIYGFLLTLTFVLLGRMIIGGLRVLLRRYGIGLVRTVVVGSGVVDRIAKGIKEERVHGRQLVAVVSDDSATDELNKLYGEAKFDELIISEGSDDNQLLDLIDWAETRGCSVVLVPSLLSVRSSNTETGSLAGAPVLFLRSTPLDGWGRVYKRIMDIIVSLLLIIILLPIFIVIAILVKLTSPGPLIFSQERVGQDGRRIVIHKFRSMHVDADKKYPEFGGWAADEKSDPRITSFGRFIRRTNLDEIPQFFDVLFGRMSLVGPRPELPRYVNEFAQDIPNYLKRHNIKVGLTGWAQINGLRGATPIPERTKYDLYYLENWSIWFDMRIIISTGIQTIRGIFSI